MQPCLIGRITAHPPVGDVACTDGGIWRVHKPDGSPVPYGRQRLGRSLRPLSQSGKRKYELARFGHSRIRGTPGVRAQRTSSFPLEACCLADSASVGADHQACRV
jgi:hypothetical protein